ncbi:MAG: hypothetical protein RL119_1146, partial [Actinomycetota bacterium]
DLIVVGGKNGPISARVRTILVPKPLDEMRDPRDKFTSVECVYASAGVKFKDAELLGIPTIVIVGKGLADGVVEVRDRRSGQTRHIPAADAAAVVTTICTTGWSEN